MLKDDGIIDNINYEIYIRWFDEFKNEIPIKPKARFKIVIMCGILFFNLNMDYIFFHLLYL